MPLLVSIGQADGEALVALLENRNLPVRDQGERQMHWLQRVLPKLSGRHRRHAVRVETRGFGQPDEFLYRLWNLRDRLSDGYSQFRG